MTAVSVCLRQQLGTKIPVWLHFCLKATKDGTVIIGELFAEQVVKRSGESQQKVSLYRHVFNYRECFAQLGTLPISLITVHL